MTDLARRIAEEFLLLPRDPGEDSWVEACRHDLAGIIHRHLAAAEKKRAERDARIFALWQYAYDAHWWAEASEEELRDARTTREKARGQMCDSELELMRLGLDLDDGFNDGLKALRLCSLASVQDSKEA